MAFVSQTYNAVYLENALHSTEAINDAAGYGVTITPASVLPGEKYWRVIGIHHLTPLENWGNHHIYVDALDLNGNRVRNPIGWVGWTWDDRHANEPALPIPVDKPDYEPGANIAVGKNQIISVWMEGRNPDGRDRSDKVSAMRTTHPDEPLPDGALHNTWGHHSFYVVFQETVKQPADLPAHSVIFGRLADGGGETLHLLKDDKLVQYLTLETNATAFRFEALPPGTYNLKVKGVAVGRGGIELDGQNAVEVNLAMPAPQVSVISGVVTNGLGYTIILGKGSVVINRQTLPPNGSFRFEGLPAGVYNLAVWDTALKVTDIDLDGRNSRTINLTLDETAPEQAKPLDHYVLFGPPQSRGRRTNFLIAADYLLFFSLPAGFSAQTAKLARRVTIIGEGVIAAEVEAIRQSGAEVEQLTGDSYQIETTLAGRIRTGQAFGA